MQNTKIFLPFPPYGPDAFQRASEQIKGRHYPRKELQDILYQYNQSIGNDVQAFKKIEQVNQPGSTCVVTGQQLGFMGGPAYTILKGITCLQVARETNSVPIFWLATEDHDTVEIDHAYLIDFLGNLKNFHLSLPKDGQFVEELTFNFGNVQVFQEFLSHVGFDAFPAPAEGASYALSMAAFLAKIFAGTGMVFIEPRYLRTLGIPFFHKEIEHSSEIQNIIEKTTQKLIADGGEAVIKPSEGTNLFFKVNGRYRRKIQKKPEGFTIGNRIYSDSELKDLIDKHPELFSLNVSARPVFQSLLIPTLAYVAGPNEMAYHLQLKDYFAFHDVPMPWIVPRISATLIDPFASDILEKCKLSPWDEIPMHWHAFMQGLDDGIKEMEADWAETAIKYFSNDMTKDQLQRYVRYGAQKIKKRISKIRLKRKGIPYYGLHYLRDLIHPHGKMQERVLNWCGFQAHSKENLVLELLQQTDWKAQGNFWCFL